MQWLNFLLLFAFIPQNAQIIEFIIFWLLELRHESLPEKDRSLPWMLGHIASFATSFGLP